MVAFQQLPVDSWLVVVTLEVGSRRQLDEVPVTLGRLGEKCEVVVQLLAAVAVAAGVVDAAFPDGSLVAGVRRHVGLCADDGRYAALAALLVEVEDSVHVAVIGDRQRRLAVRLGRGHHVGDPRRAVEHRVFGMGVQMDERRAAVRCALRHLDQSLPTPCPQRVSTVCGGTTRLSLALSAP